MEAMAHLRLTSLIVTVTLFSHFLIGLCENPESLQYSQESLHLVQDSGMRAVDTTSVFPAEIVWNGSYIDSKNCEFKHKVVGKRGRCGAVHQRLKAIKEFPSRLSSLQMHCPYRI